MAIASRTLRVRTIELPDLQRWTGTLERRIDPCIGVVQEWVDPRPLRVGQSGAIRGKLGYQPSVLRQRSHERHQFRIQLIVPLQDNVSHPQAAEYSDGIGSSQLSRIDVNLVVVIAPSPQPQQAVRGLGIR